MGHSGACILCVGGVSRLSRAIGTLPGALPRSGIASATSYLRKARASPAVLS